MTENAADPVPTETEEPEPVADQPDVTDAPPISKWPWWVSAGVAVVMLVVVIGFLSAGWYYVATRNETQEKEDYEQLLNIIDRVQSLGLFVLGAILGVTASGAAASGAAKAAKHNKDEAKKQHEKAKRNEHAAGTNQKVASAARHDVLAVADALDDVLKTAGTDQAVTRIRIPRSQLQTVMLDTNRPEYAGLRRVEDDSPQVTTIPVREADIDDDVPDHADAQALLAQVRDRWAGSSKR